MKKKLVAILLFVSGIAVAQTRVARITKGSVTTSSVTILANNANRLGFCIMAIGTGGTNTGTLYFHTSSVAATVQTATAANSIALAPTAGLCYDGSSVYTGPITAIGDSANQHWTVQEWP